MKITNTVLLLTCSALAASGAYVEYASSAPVVSPPMMEPAPPPPAVSPPMMTPAPSPPAVTLTEFVSMSPVPILTVEFIFSSTSPAVTSEMPRPTLAPAPPPAQKPWYAANPPPSITFTPIIPTTDISSTPVFNSSPFPVEPVAPLPSPDPTPTPVPAPVYNAKTYNKREINQDDIDNLVNGDGAVVFDAAGKTYMLLRLPVNVAEEAMSSDTPLRKRDTSDDLVRDATSGDLNDDAVLYDLLGKIFARVVLPVTTNIDIVDPEDGNGLLRRDTLEDLLGEIVASVAAPVNIVANIKPDEDGDGIVPNLLGEVSATIQASPTATLHLIDSDNGSLLKRDGTLNDLVGEVLASVVAPVNIVANIKPDEDGDGVVPNLLGEVSATVEASPTVTLHIIDTDSDNNEQLAKRDGTLNDLVGEVLASVVAPVNIIANIKPDEDGDGVVPNLLGEVSATIEASPTVTLHIIDTDSDNNEQFAKRDGTLNNLVGEVLASAEAPIHIVANIKPDEDGDGLVPNLLGEVSATVEASPTVTLHIIDTDSDNSDQVAKRDGTLNDLVGEVLASAEAPIHIVANIKPDEDGDGLVPNLLGEVSATVEVSPTVTLHIIDTDSDNNEQLAKRDGTLNNLVGEVLASAEAPIHIVANIKPDEDGDGLVPNLLGEVSATIEASPTVTLHIIDTDSDNSDQVAKRDGTLNDLVGEVIASIEAPIHIVANIKPDEDGDGLVPNLLGEVSATIEASPTVTLHILDADNSNTDTSEIIKRDIISGHDGIFTEPVDDTHVAIYIPVSSFINNKIPAGALSSIVSVNNIQSDNASHLAPTKSESPESMPTTTSMDKMNSVYLRVVVPSDVLS